ncbi:unnamed protein product [Urochloa humidicola]
MKKTSVLFLIVAAGPMLLSIKDHRQIEARAFLLNCLALIKRRTPKTICQIGKAYCCRHEKHEQSDSGLPS